MVVPIPPILEMLPKERRGAVAVISQGSRHVLLGQHLVQRVINLRWYSIADFASLYMLCVKEDQVVAPTQGGSLTAQIVELKFG